MWDGVVEQFEELLPYDKLISFEELAERCDLPRGVIKSLVDIGEITPLVRRGNYVRFDWDTCKKQLIKARGIKL